MNCTVRRFQSYAIRLLSFFGFADSTTPARPSAASSVIDYSMATSNTQTTASGAETLDATSPPALAEMLYAAAQVPNSEWSNIVFFGVQTTLDPPTVRFYQIAHGPPTELTASAHVVCRMVKHKIERDLFEKQIDHQGHTKH